ncbi:MAG: outer membrane beta-barrel protein [Bdellovibrionales bacterium]|nr:outer membrane beta-barrel protein [Bdellovibrionales bacterium]
MKSSILALFFLLTFGTSSQASMLEFRVGGSYHTVNPSDFNEFLKDNLDEDNIDSVKAIVTLTGDGIFYLPMIPLGIGARVDWIGIPTQESDGTEFDFSLSRLALLVNYRVFDEFFYFGPIATLGLYHGLEMSVSGAEEVEGETYDYDFKIDDYKGASFSVGAEAGIKVAFFMVGEFRRL